MHKKTNGSKQLGFKATNKDENQAKIVETLRYVHFRIIAYSRIISNLFFRIQNFESLTEYNLAAEMGKIKIRSLKQRDLEDQDRDLKIKITYYTAY